MKDNAIIVYVQHWDPGWADGRFDPKEQNKIPKVFFEFFNMYTSYKHINAQSNTDIIVFCDSKAYDYLPEDVIRVKMEPVSFNGIFKEYHRMNSLICFQHEFIDSNVRGKYKNVMKCDVDTFLTPKFKDIQTDKIMCGKWSSFSPEVYDNLKRVASEMNLSHRGIPNIGTCIFGESDQVLDVLQCAGDVAKYLCSTEWPRAGDGEWPGWYKWVSVMYSMDIAMNHLGGDFNLTDELDHPSFAGKSVNDVYAIHCSGTRGRPPYEKHLAYQGEYDNIDQSALNPDKIHDYCLWILHEHLNNKNNLYKFK